MKKYNLSSDKSISEVLAYFVNYPKKEIPLMDIEKYLLKPLGFDEIQPKKGSIYTSHHRLLENFPGIAPTGNITFHVIHGRKRLYIRKQSFRRFTVPALRKIIELLEEG